jgi:hypothetical protein
MTSNASLTSLSTGPHVPWGSSITVSVKGSILLSHYPWSNGLVLLDNKEALLQAALDGRKEDPLVNMALVSYPMTSICSPSDNGKQKLASEADIMAAYTTCDRHLAMFLEKFFFPDVSDTVQPVNMMQHLFDGPVAPSNRYLAVAGDIVFWQRLVDIISDVIGIPRQKITLVPRASTQQPFVTRLGKVS